MQHTDISRGHLHEPSPLTPTKMPLGAPPGRSISRTDLSRTVSASVDDGGGYPSARAVRRRSCSSRCARRELPRGRRLRLCSFLAMRQLSSVPRGIRMRLVTRIDVQVLDQALGHDLAQCRRAFAVPRPSETKSVHRGVADRARRNPATCTFYRRSATAAPLLARENAAGMPAAKRARRRRPMNLLLLIVLLVLVVGALPTWPYSAGWGYYPSGGLGLILLLLVILALTRTAP